MACVMSIYHTMMCWLGGKTFVACGSVVERKGKFGAHSGIKTGYLFGVWGGG